jgi:hypothetical protein
VVAIRRVDSGLLNNTNLNGIATAADGTQIYVTFTGPGEELLRLPAFGG